MEKFLFWIYLANAVLLINHEIDSAYWKEWDLFKLPGGITGFLIIHFHLKKITRFFYITDNFLLYLGLRSLTTSSNTGCEIIVPGRQNLQINAVIPDSGAPISLWQTPFF